MESTTPPPTTDAPPPTSGGSLLSGLAAAPPAAAAPPVTPIPIAGGAPPAPPAGGSEWLKSLPETLRGNPSLATIPTLEALAENYIHTKGLVGKKMQPPAEGAPPEEVAAWRKTVGAPETADGYGDLRPADFPEAHWDKETEGKFAALAHKHHLTPAAVKEIIDLHTGSVQAGLGRLAAEDADWQQKETASLKKAWGGNFEQEAHAAATFVKALGLDPLSPAFRNAELVMAMARGAKMLMGDTLVGGSSAGIAGGIEARIADIRRSPEYLGQRGEPAQQQAQANLHALMQHGKAA